MATYGVFYMKPEWFRDGINGAEPDLHHLGGTHTFLRVVQAASLDEVYSIQQAHHWAVDYKRTNAMLDQLGLRHTSMSVGDIIVESSLDPTGSGQDAGVYLVAEVGFKRWHPGEGRWESPA
jgi:hypothetical protein